MALVEVRIGTHRLSNEELLCLRDALRTAAQRYHDDAAEWVGKQTALQSGERLTMIAGGAKGVEACRRMIAKFHVQESDTRELLARVEGTPG